MKKINIVFVLASVALLGSCSSSKVETICSQTSEAVSTSAEKKTMGFLNDGQFCISVSTHITGGPFTLNGAGHQGDGHIGDLGGAFALGTRSPINSDVYITIAKSVQEGSIEVGIWGIIEKDKLAEELETINTAVGVPNKVFISIDVQPNIWPKNYDTEMDEKIQAKWNERNQ